MTSWTLFTDQPPKPEPPPYSIHMAAMIRYHGPAPDGVTCGQCRCLKRFMQSASWMKCGQYKRPAGHDGPATDWRAKWPGCGQFKPRDDDQ